MNDFASLLASIARNNAMHADPARTRLTARLGHSELEIMHGALEAARAYAEQNVRGPAPSVPLPDSAALRRAIAASTRDTTRLRALRRLAARALHPDHGGDGAQLAECNALIDDALRISRRRT